MQNGINKGNNTTQNVACAICRHWRRLDRILTDYRDGTACSDILPVFTVREATEEIPIIDVASSIKGLCLKTMQVTESMRSRKRPEKCCFEPVNDELDFYKKSFSHTSDAITRLLVDSEQIPQNIRKKYVLVNAAKEHFCGLCHYWRETYDSVDDSEPEERLSVMLPISGCDEKGLYNNKVLMAVKVKGCCMCGTRTTHKLSNDSCSAYVFYNADYRYFERSHYMPMLSPKIRFINSMRIIRSLFTFEKFYYKCICEDIDNSINSGLSDEIGKTALEFRSRILNAVEQETLSVSAVKATGADKNTINHYVSEEKRIHRYNTTLMYRFSHYFDIPLNVLYGMPFFQPLALKTFENLDLSITVKLTSLKKLFYKHKFPVPEFCRQPIKLIEDLIYPLSVLLKIYSDTDRKRIDRVIGHYETHKPIRRLPRADYIKNNNLNYFRGNSTLHELSLITGITQKKLEKCIELEKSDKGSEKTAQYLYWCARALNVPSEFILYNKKRHKLRVIKAFIKMDDVEMAETQTQRIYDNYLAVQLCLLYEAFPEWVVKVAELYKKYGLDKTIHELALNLSKLEADIKKRVGTNVELYSPNYQSLRIKKNTDTDNRQ